MRNADIPWGWTYAEDPPAPPARDVLRRGDAGRDARLHHLVHPLQGLAQGAMLGAFRHMPAPWVAAIAGRALGPLAHRAGRRTMMLGRMRRVVARLRPDLTEDGIEALLARWYANAARAMCEYPLLGTVAAPPVTRVEGLGHVAAVRAEGRNAALLSVHTGMWETISYRTSRDFDDSGVGAWQPQPNRFDNRLVARERHRLGIKVLPASPQLARRLMRTFAHPGNNMPMLVDEISEGRTKFPLFGRAPEGRSNLGFSLRMTQRIGGVVMPITMTRLPRPDPDGARFVFRYHAPWEVGAGEAGLREAAMRLDAVLGGHVLAHLDQWYMLSNVSPEGIAPPSAA